MLAEEAREDKTGCDNGRLATRWLSIIKTARNNWKGEHNEIRRLRLLSGGLDDNDDAAFNDSKKKKKRVNLILSTINGLVPHVYAKMPEVAIEPKDAIDPHEYPWLRNFARTLEIVLNEQLEKAQLKRKSKAAVRSCLSARAAWAKVMWQQDIQTDPVIAQRINDTQDNLAELGLMIKEIADPVALADIEVKREELRYLVDSLEDQKEVIVSSGLVVDVIKPEHIIIESHIDAWEDWDKTQWIAQIIPMPLEKAKALFPDIDWNRSGVSYANSGDIKPIVTLNGFNNRDDLDSSVEVIEVWDKKTMTVYTICDGVTGFLREPYQPELVSESWFPFKPLGLINGDARFYPYSVSELIEELQDEYLETRDKYAEHRAKAIPKMLFDAESVDDKTMTRLVNGDIGENIPVSANGKSLAALFDFTKYPPIDGGLYDTNAVRFDIEAMSGLQDAARGSVVRAKTATEADIMQSALSSRVSEMQDAIEEWVESIALDGAQLALQAMHKEDVEAITGAGAIWPAWDMESIFRRVRVKIRAGSSGKPDKMAQQKSWAQIMPLAMEMMQKVAAAQAAGQVELADAMRGLLAELLRRLDERFDIDQLLPRRAAPMAMGQDGAGQQQLMGVVQNG